MINREVQRGVGIGLNAFMLSVLLTGPSPELRQNPQVADPDQYGVCDWPYLRVSEEPYCDTPLITADVAVVYLGDDENLVQEIIEQADELETDAFKGILDLSYTVISLELESDYDNLLVGNCIDATKSPANMVIEEKPNIATNFDYAIALSPDPSCGSNGGNSNGNGTADVYGVSDGSDPFLKAADVLHEIAGHEILGSGHSGMLDADSGILVDSYTTGVVKLDEYFDSAIGFRQYANWDVMGSGAAPNAPVPSVILNCSSIIQEAHGNNSPFGVEMIGDVAKLNATEIFQSKFVSIKLDDALQTDILDGSGGSISFDQLIIQPNWGNMAVVYFFSSEQCRTAQVGIIASPDLQAGTTTIDMGKNGIFTVIFSEGHTVSVVRQ